MTLIASDLRTRLSLMFRPVLAVLLCAHLVGHAAADRPLDAQALRLTVVPSFSKSAGEAQLPGPTPFRPVALVAAAAQSSWSARGEIVFDVFRGDGNFRLGTTTHRWQQANGRYSMEARVETTGLVALFKAVDYVQRSEGRVLPQGLRPSSFSVERGGKRREWSEFNWQAGRVKLFKDGKAREVDVAPGDQDVLSLWHQLSLGGWRSGGELTVVTGKSAAKTRIEALGSERSEVPAGRFETRHLRATATDGSLVLDIWYALDGDMVPVRIRMQDRKGEVLDQRARVVVLDGVAVSGARE